MVSLKDIKLKNFIKKLSEYRGRHTEFVSVYIPPRGDITKIIQHLEQEQGTATNIKDAKTRKAVITALEKMIRFLRTYENNPIENGLGVFSGNISEKENTTDYQVFYIEPPVPINQKLYRCDQKFTLYPLEDIETNENAYGLVTIDKSDATIGLLEGNNVTVLKSIHSNVPGKFKTGGQSAQRFARIREGAAVEFYKRVADILVKEFTYKENLSGIIVGGPGTTKNNFVDGNYINETLKDKIISIKDVTYTDVSGLRELVDRSEDVLVAEEMNKEKIVIKEFLRVLAVEPAKASYGEKNVGEALAMAAVEKLIMLDKVDTQVLENFSNLAEESGTQIFIVTDNTPEGAQIKALTGVCAILRYQIN